MRRLALALGAAGFVGVVVVTGQSSFTPTIPRTWDDRAVASLQVPLAIPDASPIHIRSSYYYGIPVRPIYKNYPVYHPGQGASRLHRLAETPGATGHLRCGQAEDGRGLDCGR